MVKHSFDDFWTSLMQSSRQLFLDVTYCKNAKIRYGAITPVAEAERHWALMARSLKKAIRYMAKAASVKDMEVGPRIAVVNHWIEVAGSWAKDARDSATEAMAITDHDVRHTFGEQPERLRYSSLDSLVVNEGVTKQTRTMAMFDVAASEFMEMITTELEHQKPTV